MEVAQDRGEDVVLTHPVRAVRRPLNFIVALSHISRQTLIRIAPVVTLVIVLVPSVRYPFKNGVREGISSGGRCTPSFCGARDEVIDLCERQTAMSLVKRHSRRCLKLQTRQ